MSIASVRQTFLDLLDVAEQGGDEEKALLAASAAFEAALHPKPMRDADRALWVRRMSRCGVLQTIADRIATAPTGQVAALLDKLHEPIETLAGAFDKAIGGRA